MSSRRCVLAPHRRSFEQAPRVRQGQAVRHLHDDAEHPGWFFGIAPDGTEGYFPRRWFDVDEKRGIAHALRAYDAMELTIESGQEVECLEVVSGWMFVRTLDRAEGWIPAACVGRP